MQAFESLSPRFRKRLEGLTAIHSNDDGVAQELKNGESAVMRRQILTAEHPIVRVHPVTGQKALCKVFKSPFVCELTESQMSIPSIPNTL